MKQGSSLASTVSSTSRLLILENGDALTNFSAIDAQLLVHVVC